MTHVVVRYRPEPDRVEENQQLVEAVFAELAERDPGGVRYATFRLDGGTFVHVAEVDGDENPLPGLASFQAFQDGIAERCVEGEGPDPQPAVVVGSYRLLSD